MGYRLDIDGFTQFDKRENLFYGTKYYGYEDLEDSISYLYLCSIGKFDGDEFFGYDQENTIFLSRREMKIFLYLYNLDLNNHLTEYEIHNSGITDYFINDEKIQNILEQIESEEHINYILSWG